MEYIKLGNSSLTVSRLCLGCMGFGDSAKGRHSWTLDEEQSEEIIKAALCNGINFFDTAAAYQNGTSEMFLGRALKKLVPRDKAVIATKFVPRTEEERQTVTGRRHVISSLEGSLKRLGTDYVDLFVYHMWDYFTPVEEIMEGLNEAVVSGKARYTGISNCYAWQLQKANDFAEKKGYAQFISVQNHYNLLFREEEREMFGCCAANNIAMTPYSPLASGRLVKPANETTRRLREDSYAKGKYDKTADIDRVIVERVAELARRKGMTRIQIAIGWLLKKVAAPVVGATKVSHITEAVKGVGVTLTEEEMRYLEEPYVPHALVGVMANPR